MKKTILAAAIGILSALAIGNTQDLFGDLTTNIVGVKYQYRIFNLDNTPSNSRIEYLYNKRSKACLARITDSTIVDEKVIESKVYYVDVTAANCK